MSCKTSPSLESIDTGKGSESTAATQLPGSQLSDASASSLQLCPPCQRAVRANQVSHIHGPQRKGRGKHAQVVSSCVLCSAIERGRRESKCGTSTGERLIHALRSQIFRHDDCCMPRKTPFRRFNGSVACRPGNGSPFERMEELMILSGINTRSTSMVEQLLNPACAMAKTVEVDEKPIVRIVPVTKIDPALVQGWISACENDHDACHKVATSSQAHNRTAPPLVLVDVQRRRLVQGSFNSRYLALSYVWGNVAQMTLRRANLSALEEDGSLDAFELGIPQVVKDAIDFVRSIDERYLWVDSLGIVWNEEPTRSFNAARIGEIYRGALCNLIAVDGQDAMSELPGVQPRTRNPKIVGACHDLYFAFKRPDLAWTLFTSPYETRAWTFSERLLSTRCLYFTREQAYFHCQTALWSEDRYEHFQQHADPSGMYPSLTWLSQRSLRTWAEKLKAYTELVQEYSRRRMSFESDRLEAFSGIADARGEEWDWSFVSGLPVEAFLVGLMWISSNNVQDRIRTPRDDLPSWSWAGWSDAVHYRLVSDASQLSSAIDHFDLSTADGWQLVKALTGMDLQDSPPNPQLDVKIPMKDPLNTLVFQAEVVSGGFSFLATIADIPKYLNGSINPSMLRIFDRERRACGLLFLSGNATAERQPSTRSRFQRPGCQFVLLSTSTAKPLVTVLNDSLFDESDSHENLYHEYYRYRLDDTLNIMLIHYANERYAERVAIGQIHARAWKQAEPTRRQVRLR